MSRPASSALSLVLALLMTASLATAQDSPSQSAPLQLVYLQDGATLTTFDVNPETLYARQIGQPITLPLTTFNAIVPSLNGQILYVFGLDSAQNQHLWVYATDASGVPQNPPLQELSAKGVGSFELDSSASFAYAIVGIPSSQNQNLYSIERFTVDPTTGKLSLPTIVAQYPLYGPCQGAESAGPSLDGFSANGQKFYDHWFCADHDSVNAVYYERTANLQTGALGAEIEIYSWLNGDDGFDTVNIKNNQIFDFSIPNDYNYGISTFSIYSVVPNSTTPSLQCGASMLEACGYAFGELLYPGGQYAFFQVAESTYDIASIDLATKTVTDTGSYVPSQIAAFSPDGSIVYGFSLQTTSYTIPIYGFNAKTAQVTTNGYTIYAPSNLDTFWPVYRQ